MTELSHFLPKRSTQVDRPKSDVVGACGLPESGFPGECVWPRADTRSTAVRSGPRGCLESITAAEPVTLARDVCGQTNGRVSARPNARKLAASRTQPLTKDLQRPKALWVSTYRSISDADALAAYAKLAGPALQAAGGRFLARSMPSAVFEAGLEQRVVVIEFDSVDAAVAAHDSAPY